MIYDLQKASLMKRFSAFLLDFVIFSIIFTGCLLIFHHITGYSNYADLLMERKSEIEAKYDIPSFEEEYKINIDSFQLLTDEEKNKLPENVRNSFADCIQEINTDEEYGKYLLILLNLLLVIISFSMFFPFLIVEFIIPLLFKNGQTLGKKIFSIAVMRIDAVKISPLTLFVRAILGKYTIGTMVPLLMVFMLLFTDAVLIPLAIVLLVLLLQIVMIITTKTNSFLHDVLSSTVVVDFQSQMIFNSVEDLNAYKLRIHSEEAKKADY